MDLFTSSQTFQLQVFVSLFPGPMALTSDAFLFNWSCMRFWECGVPAFINTFWRLCAVFYF